MAPDIDFLPGLSRETFFAEYFRRKPFVLRGGARTLLNPPLTVPEFDAVRERMTREQPVQVVERPGEAWFVRVADLASERLAALSETVRRTLDWPNVWCDAVQTLGPSGIGCHFDDSDNFVLQQEGTKRWQLSPPSGLPDESLRRRMVGDHSVGTAYMPEDALEFELNPGDLLYLPIFWSHWGVSDGPSLSVSLALNSASALDAVLPLITSELAQRRAWWEPMPPGPADLDALWEALADPALRARVETLLAERHGAWVANGLSEQRVEESGLGESGPAAEAAEQPLTLSLGGGALRALLHRPQRLPEPKELLLDGATEASWAAARAEHSRHVLLRLLRLLRHRSEQWGAQPRIRATAQALIDLLAAATAEDLARLALDPVVLGAVRRAEHEAAADYRETGDAFVAQLATAVLGLAARRPDILAGRTLTVAVSEPRGIAELHLGERWTAPADLPAVTEARFEPQAATPLLRAVDGSWHRAAAEPLPRVPGSSLLLLERHAWWDTAQRHGVSWHCGRLPAPSADLRERAAEALSLLADCWPQAHAEVESGLLTFTQPGTPAEWLCWPPDGETGTTGTTGTTGATGATGATSRTVESVAAGLVTVLARARWRIVTDLYPVETHALPPVTSPWDGSSRSAAWLCGQIFAARMQGELAHRLLDRGLGGAAATTALSAAAKAVDEVRAELARAQAGPGGWFETFMTTQAGTTQAERMDRTSQ
ncbi:JmjC domain-containing protein [Kitasatospora sp. NPDC051170]|uniref:JmjC domain-containing protein n=1 Tax=Kitasatospora sp. NPDC051170 TaxID=3364056 RepID=UPI0037AC9499